jgi:hypothetical protein
LKQESIAVIKYLEKKYLLIDAGIPKYYLGGNVECLGKPLKNQGLGLALSVKTYIQNFISKFESLLGEGCKNGYE